MSENTVSANEYNHVLEQLEKLQCEKKQLEEIIEDKQRVISSYEDNAAFQNNIFEIVKKQKDDQSLYLSLVLENTPNVLMVLDKNLNYILGTEKPLRKVGINTDTLGDRNFAGIFSMLLPESVVEATEKRMYEVIETGVAKEINSFKINIKGILYIFDISIVPFRNNKNEIIGIMYSLYNTTKLNEALELAEKSNRAKTLFLAKMSHEIRTPMNSISGMSELLLRDELSKSAREYAFSIKQASANLMAIINDILDFSKIESGMFEIVPVNYLFSSVINDVINIIRMRVVEKPILFTANIDSALPNRLIGDEFRIRQILLNILSNAYKYCNEGLIEIAVSGDITEKNTVVLKIVVTDSGIGIKEEDLNKLFGDFVQVDMVRNNNIEGTGLGLAITKSLVQIMGGNISASSIYGKGSSFTITIPQRFDEYERFATAENPNEKNVLVYETRQAYASSIINSITNLGVKCTLVINQSQFLERLDKNAYQFIFISSYLFETTEKIIRKMGLDVKLVLLTEYGETVIDTNDVKTIIMPAHTISIANILNNVEQDVSVNEYSEGNVRFIAPKAKILIIDDIETNIKVAEGLLSPYRMEIDSCKSGAEAIKMVQETRYDLIFMDHMMPEMDGIEATLIIRKLKGSYFKKLPIIALTANAVTGIRELFLENGFNDFLAKPIEITKLNAILETWLPKSKREKFIVKETRDTAPVFEIEGIDVNAGIFKTGGSPENYIKTLEVYCKDCIEKIEELRSCLETEKISLYATYVHAVKSASASVGAAGLSEQARLLEDAGKNGNIKYIRKNHDSFVRELEKLISNIIKIASKTQINKDLGVISDGALKSQIIGLRESLINLDMDNINSIIESLNADNIAHEVKSVIEKIENNILICEYDEAIVLVDKLIDSQ